MKVWTRRVILQLGVLFGPIHDEYKIQMFKTDFSVEEQHLTTRL
jgi:hypothetical protein